MANGRNSTNFQKECATSEDLFYHCHHRQNVLQLYLYYFFINIPIGLLLGFLSTSVWFLRNNCIATILSNIKIFFCWCTECSRTAVVNVNHKGWVTIAFYLLDLGVLYSCSFEQLPPLCPDQCFPTVWEINPLLVQKVPSHSESESKNIPSIDWWYFLSHTTKSFPETIMLNHYTPNIS